MIILYNLIFFLFIIICSPFIISVIIFSEKRRKTVLHRLGMVPLSADTRKKAVKNKKKPIWVHALSVGEVLSAAPMVDSLRESFCDYPIVLSVSTKTGFEIANRLLKEKVDSIFFFPYDLFFSVKHICNQVDPAIVHIVESEIWPNFMCEMKKRNVPVIFVNARLSEKSFSGYRRISFFIRPVLKSFAKVCTQSIEDSMRFKILGVPLDNIKLTGNIKFDQKEINVSIKEIQETRRSMNIAYGQKIIIAGSTHNGEEAVLLEVFLMLKKKFQDLLLIIVPRDPHRGRSVCRLFKSVHFAAVIMKDIKTEKPATALDVIVVDKIGSLKKLYALADVTFVGGSLVNRGGHNPLEPAAFSKPIIFGKHMSSFAQIPNMLVEADGAICVQNSTGLYEAAKTLLEDNVKADEMGKKAFQIFNSNKGAINKTLKVVEGYIH